MSDDQIAFMRLDQFSGLVERVPYGKKLPSAVYLMLTDPSLLPKELVDTIRRAEVAARPDPAWNLLKLHTDELAISFLSYPDFDIDPHPALAEGTKINLNTGTVVRTDYRGRSNPPILHRKETFLPPSDKRVEAFAELTQQEEKEGLYRDSSRIGLRMNWQALLKRKRLSYDGHRLTTLLSESGGNLREETSREVARHRTAIKRYDLSRPVKLLLERGLVQKQDTVFDYGCGHGMDVEALQSLGYTASGWDPAFRPNEAKSESDVINLGYVLNVIEGPDERIKVLRDAFQFARRLMIVSTMVAGKETDSHTRPYGDGFLTKTNTFQKFYEPGELESLIEDNLGVEAITLGLGICVVFRDPDQAELFQAARSRRRIDWSEIGTQLRFSAPAAREQSRANRYELHRELLDEFWAKILELGRIPEVGEFDRLADVKKAAGGISRAFKLVLTHHGEPMWQLARQSRAEDVLVYLAMTQFRKRFLRREIPMRTKHDIKAFFGDLSAAQSKARDLLFAAGDPDEVELAVESLEFGLYDPDEKQLTFHRSLLSKLPPTLRIYVYCAALRYGNPEEADLIKIHVRSGKLTFLHFDDFDGKKHPVLQTRIKINLRTQFVQVFDHRSEAQMLPDKAIFSNTSRLLGVRA
jgi:DNA phosphorothioation-associated putative methyltransferase